MYGGGARKVIDKNTKKRGDGVMGLSCLQVMTTWIDRDWTEEEEEAEKLVGKEGRGA